MPSDFSEEPRKYNIVNEHQFDLLVNAFNAKGKVPKTLADHEIHSYGDADERGEPEFDNPVNVVNNVRNAGFVTPDWFPHEDVRNYKEEDYGGVNQDQPNRFINSEFDRHTNSLGVFPDIVEHSPPGKGPSLASMLFDVDGRRMAVDYDIHAADPSISAESIPHIEEEGPYLQRLQGLGYKPGMRIPSAESHDLAMESMRENLRAPISRDQHFHNSAGTGKYDDDNE